MNLFYVVVAFFINQSLAGRRDYSQSTCGCHNGMCTINFPLPKKAKVLNNCKSTDRLERRLTHLTAMVHALHDEMVSMATKMEKQEALIARYTGTENTEDELEQSVRRIEQRQEWEERIAQAGLVCPMDFELVGSKCYLLMEELFNWTYSSQICKDKGANLVVIETETQQKHVETILKKYYSEENVWIGANSINHPANFVWNSESDASEYYNWAPGMPVIKDNLRCVYMSSDSKWQWKAGPCDKQFYFICSRPPTRN